MRALFLFLWFCVIVSVFNGCSSARFAAGKRSNSDMTTKDGVQEGYASYYAEEFHGRKTANGEMYDMNALTAAHRTLPFGTKVKVRNTINGKTVVVRINDRGPFKSGRIIDVSLAAAKQLEMIGSGTSWVQLQILEDGSESK